MNQTKYILVLLSIVCSVDSPCQSLIAPGQYRYTTYTTKDGKAHNSTLATIQDADGFIWLASHNGLDRFDGYHFVTYQNNKDDSTSLPYNRVSAFCTDAEYNLWIGTAGRGLARYIPEKDAFESFVFTEEHKEFEKQENDITSLLTLENGKIMIGTRGGQVNLFDTETHQFSNIPISNSVGSTTDNYTVVRNIHHGKNNEVWIDTSVGLLYYDAEEHTLCTFYKTPGDLDNLQNNTSQITTGEDGTLWCVTVQGEVLKFDPNRQNKDDGDGLFIRTPFKISGPAFALYKNSKHELMVGSQDGLYFFNLLDSTASISRNISGDDQSLSSNRILHIYQDSNGLLYLGTDNEGVIILDVHQKSFLSFRNNPLNGRSLLDNYVHGFAQDQRGNIWVGTNLGASQFRKEHQDFINHSFLNIEGFQPKVNTICHGNYPTLWIGTSAGLLKYNTLTRKHQWYKHSQDPRSLGNNEVFSLLLDKNKETLWIGTWGGGLNKLDLRNESFEFFDIDSKSFLYNAILAISQDVSGGLWLGTYKHGVVHFDPTSSTMKYYNSDLDTANELGDNVVISMFIDEFGTVLAGTTSAGIAHFDPSVDAFRSVGQGGRQVNMEVKGLLTDKFGDIWASTSKGITKFEFDPKRKGNSNTFEGHSVSTLSYTEEDGLQSEIFYKLAYLKDTDGFMYFGGANGFNYFLPEKITKNPYKSETKITAIKISNAPVTPGKLINDRVLLDKPIYQTEKIELNYNENTLTFEFSAMNFVNPEKIQYQYMLEGLETEWVSTDHSGRIVTYSNLAPNSYEFMVKSTGIDGDWNDRYVSLGIEISPPWWKTNWFQISAFLLLIAIIVVIVKMRELNLRRSKNRLEKTVSARTREVMEQGKEIQAQNEELQAMNEEMQTQAEQMVAQNSQLTETQVKLLEVQKELKTINNSLEGKVKTRTAHLEKVINELDMFVYSASHDLGAPLKSLMGLVHLTKAEIADPKTSENIVHMETSILKLENVIAALKQYSRNSSLKVVLESIRLRKLLDETLTELKFLKNFNKIDIRIDVPEKTIVQTDSQRIKSVVQNLLDNAIKYSDLKKSNPYIRISYSKMPDTWVLRFEDNGIGIPESYLQSIFKMFNRATEQSSGSGLGLFIVKESLAKLHASVKVESIESMGTTFTITHPNIIDVT